MIAVLCLCSLCGQVAEWFKRQTNMGRPGSVMRAVKAGAREGHALSCNVLADYASVWSMCVD